MYNLNERLEYALEQERRTRTKRQQCAYLLQMAAGRLWRQRLGAVLVAVGQRLARTGDRAAASCPSPTPPAAPCSGAA